MEMIHILGIIGFGAINAGLMMFIQNIKDKQMYKNYLKEYKNKLKNIVE